MINTSTLISHTSVENKAGVSSQDLLSTLTASLDRATPPINAITRPLLNDDIRYSNDRASNENSQYPVIRDGAKILNDDRELMIQAKSLAASGHKDEAIALLGKLKNFAGYAASSLKTLTVEQTVQTLLSFNDTSSEELYMASQKMTTGNDSMAQYYLEKAGVLPDEEYKGNAVPVPKDFLSSRFEAMYNQDLGMRFLAAATQAMQGGDSLMAQGLIRSASQFFTGGPPV